LLRPGANTTGRRKGKNTKSMRACVRRIRNIVDETAFREEDRAMNRNYRFSPLLLLALALPVVSRVEASEIRDRAGMFSPDAVKKAQSELDRLERKLSLRQSTRFPNSKSQRRTPPAEGPLINWPLSASRRSGTREFIC
jgi:hypothetical protein